MTRKDAERIAQGLANARPVFKDGPDYSAWFSAMAEVGCIMLAADPSFPYDAFRRLAVDGPRRYPNNAPAMVAKGAPWA